MQHFVLKKGLDLPISGPPRQEIEPGNVVGHLALVGDDYIGLRPSLAVKEGERVAAGQLLFTDKKNPGVKFTAPLAGEVIAINRGERRRFQALVIRIEGEDQVTFPALAQERGPGLPAETVRSVLLDSGLWPALRTRPFGKVAAVDRRPSALFVTAMDTRPLAADPAVVIGKAAADFRLGLQVLHTLVPKIFLCAAAGIDLPGDELTGITSARFAGPHPAGLASTHIHFLDPVAPGKQVWQIGYQDLIAIGHLFRTGRLLSSRVVALAGPGVKNPRLIKAPPGASLAELCAGELTDSGPATAAAEPPLLRLLSGSVLDGRRAAGNFAYLGRYHDQVSALIESAGSAPFNWLGLGRDRFSLTPAFISVLTRFKKSGGRLAMNTALWGGRRAIFPLGGYERVMPLDIIATALLKSIATGNVEKAMELGCLELIEEDLALCGFVCPGKNDFGPMLRAVLTSIEAEG
ncbi:Na(+)-translocating NADH-quinone reductase subunit A [Desulfurivibrio sp. D14AmB]|uniref:Na(+)-translocating NADH-quinone reductase subunit A n=1 Tax=Desulfurivibrio sp. D14AmB TaxID=3374370 RepID=UPI00376EB35B